MTNKHLLRSFRRSYRKLLKVGLQCIRSQTSTTRPVKFFPNLPKRAGSYSDTVSSRINKWIVIHFILISMCIIIHCAPWLMNKINDIAQPSFHGSNQTLTRDKYPQWSYYDWCAPSTGSLNNTSGFIIEDQSVILFFVMFGLISMIGLVFYFHVTKKVRQSPADVSNRYFAHGILSLIMLIIFSLGNQAIRSFTCRPKEILYESGFTSLLGVQFLGFVTSLVGAYYLGSVFIPLFDHNTIDPASNRRYIACCRSVKRLTSHQLHS